MSQPQEEADESPAIGAPRWVKILGIGAIALIVLVIAMHLAGLTPVGHGG